MNVPKGSRCGFAAALIWLGVLGLRKGDFAQIWQPVPQWVPAREALVYLTAGISLASGIGLIFRRTAGAAARLIFAALLLWLLVLRLPYLFIQKPLVLVAWTFGATAVMLAGAWILYQRLAGDRLPFFSSPAGLRTARVLYGLSLIPFGLAHFMYLEPTTVLIPHWLPGPTLLAYLTGGCFIAAGLAVALGILAPLAAALSTLQMLLFGVIVWIPRVIAGNLNAFQWGEFVTTFVLAAAGWVVAESYREPRQPDGR